MNDYPDRDINKGAVWRNEYKNQRTQPDFTGKLNVEGVEYRVAMWEYGGDNPRAPEFNFQIETMEEYNKRKEQNQQSRPAPTNNFDDFDDDIPF